MRCAFNVLNLVLTTNVHQHTPMSGPADLCYGRQLKKKTTHDDCLTKPAMGYRAKVLSIKFHFTRGTTKQRSTRSHFVGSVAD